MVQISLEDRHLQTVTVFLVSQTTLESTYCDLGIINFPKGYNDRFALYRRLSKETGWLMLSFCYCNKIGIAYPK